MLMQSERYSRLGSHNVQRIFKRVPSAGVRVLIDDPPAVTCAVGPPSIGEHPVLVVQL